MTRAAAHSVPIALAVSFLTNDIDVDAVADGAARAPVIDVFWERSSA